MDVVTPPDLLYLSAGILLGCVIGYWLRYTVGDDRKSILADTLAAIGINGKLAHVTRGLHRIEKHLTDGEARIMGALEDITNAIDAETNTIAATIDKLRADLAAAQAKGDPPSPETLAHLQAISDRLKLLGADPSNPIPPTPAAPTDAAPTA